MKSFVSLKRWGSFALDYLISAEWLEVDGFRVAQEKPLETDGRKATALEPGQTSVLGAGKFLIRMTYLI